jgi:hypothetical protein
MNYKQVVEIISGICKNHLFVKQFGFGEISDVMQPEDNSSPNYPYVFLNPLSITSTMKSSSFSFNLICMEQTYDKYNSIIQSQSDCIEILFDIVSKINLSTDYPTLQVNDNFVFTPFVERMKDNVVGATCNITLTFANPLNGCSLPY